MLRKASKFSTSTQSSVLIWALSKGDASVLREQLSKDYTLAGYADLATNLVQFMALAMAGAGHGKNGPKKEGDTSITPPSFESATRGMAALIGVPPQLVQFIAKLSFGDYDTLVQFESRMSWTHEFSITVGPPTAGERRADIAKMIAAGRFPDHIGREYEIKFAAQQELGPRVPLSCFQLSGTLKTYIEAMSEDLVTPSCLLLCDAI